MLEHAHHGRRDRSGIRHVERLVRPARDGIPRGEQGHEVIKRRRMQLEPGVERGRVGRWRWRLAVLAAALGPRIHLAQPPYLGLFAELALVQRARFTGEHALVRVVIEERLRPAFRQP